LTIAQSHAQPSWRSRTAAIVLAGFCAFLTIYAPQPLLPSLAREFHVSAAAIALVMTATTAGVGLAAPFIGVLSDRIGRKRIIVPAALLLAIPATLASTATGLYSLLFWRFCQGIFTPGIAAVTIAYINEEWESGVGAAMSAYVAGTVLGGFSGRMIAAVIAAHASWRWAFAFLGILNATGALAMAIWLPADRHSAHPAPGGAMAAHLQNRRLLATCAVGFCVLFTLLATFTYVNFYLAAPPFRLGTQALGLLFMVYLLGMVVTPASGRYIDRVGHRVAIAAAFTGCIGGIALTLIQSLPAIVLGLAILSSGVFIAQAVTSSYIGIATSHARASAVGIYSVFYYAGGTLGSAVPGLFWIRGGWPACVGLIALVEALTIGIAWLGWRAN
jgi:MFS transporter, YNFM family, putative membrane transport protein